ncbi:MAG: cation:dicarboxylase symporter family transporter [Candidatus Eremiobacteraeota bacterium]|nr:cation:dicarboxylase symporter family transporter [Candidatus Eremiobacteraeota bacterium]
MKDKPKSTERLASFTIMGMVAGIAAGLFLGETAGKLTFFSTLYINLLQMTALPYILFSLIGGIAKLKADEAKTLAKKGGFIVLALWVIGIVILIAMPMAFPAQQTSSFFSTSVLEAPKKVDLIKIFIPSNIFKALADNIVASVVVFCVIVGLALMEMEKKDEVLRLLDTLSQLMVSITKWLANFAPYGVFSIMAVTAGTMTFNEFGRLQAFLLIYVIAFFLLTFLILPGLASLLTPFGSREVVEASRTALVLSFSTGKVLIVLPLIIESIKTLFESHDLEKDKAAATSEFILPMAYAFPTLGTILTMLFIPFAAWYSGKPMTAPDYGLYIFAGLPSFFSDVSVAIPFCLDLLKLPSDLFSLFLATGTVTKCMSAALKVMYLLVLGLLVACALEDSIRFQWRRFGTFFASSIVLTGLLIFGAHSYLSWTCKGNYHYDKVIKSMRLQGVTVPSVIARTGPNPEAFRAGESNIERIKRRGVIRIGFIPDNLPWSYYNNEGELVGFDVELAHRLAHDLEVTIEFVPFTYISLSQEMEKDYFDIAMSGIPGTYERSERMRFTDPYLYIHNALVIPDYRDREFLTISSIRTIKNLKIAATPLCSPTDRLKSSITGASFIPIKSDSDFFKGNQGGADALFTSAEGGSAWTLLYPDYQVAMPFPSYYTTPLVYPFFGGDNSRMNEYLNHWILLESHDGTIQDTYDYWILGKGSEKKEPRWSIMRNVLHWVK